MAPLVANLDDISIAGMQAARAAAFSRLLDVEKGLPSTSLELNLSKCGVHGGDVEGVTAMVKELGIRHMCQGVMVVGMPLGATVDTKLWQKPEEGQSLATLPLSAVRISCSCVPD